jgi:hypothetical protein
MDLELNSEGGSGGPTSVCSDQLFDACGGYGIECRAGFVHQDNLRLDRDCPSNAESLLLPP